MVKRYILDPRSKRLAARHAADLRAENAQVIRQSREESLQAIRILASSAERRHESEVAKRGTEKLEKKSSVNQNRNCSFVCLF
jgi:ribosomal silencing factor RsfS